MKRESINHNNQNRVKVDKNKDIMEIYDLVQKVGKGKRRHQLILSKSNKKIIYKIIKNMATILNSQNILSKNFENFLGHLNEEIKFGKVLRLSYEELTFLRKIVSLSLKELVNMQLNWYQVIRKIFNNVMIVQYRNLLKILNI